MVSMNSRILWLIGMILAAVPTHAQLSPTVAQAEGPYYPVAKPVDRDHDLTMVAGQARGAQGEVMLLTGRVVTVSGAPVSGVIVGIWQTDHQGVYLHPGDPGYAGRDRAFQGYGESVTDAAGRYGFRPILPQLYGSRPRHVHVKVVRGGRQLLTTQFYFAGGDRISTDGVGGGADVPVLQLDHGSESGRPAMRASYDIVLGP